MTTAARPQIATVWLDGCSGCHMSFLDLDERLITVLEQADLVYSPLVDRKEFPDSVDVVLVEGAVSSTEDLEKIRHIRKHARRLVSLGDCAVTANVPSMRNPVGVKALLERAYVENAMLQQGTVFEIVPPLLPQSRPVHEVVDVDVFVPGCPPPAVAIFYVLSELLAGRTPDPATVTRFGK